MRLSTHTLLAVLLGLIGMESAMAIEEPHYEVRVSQPPFRAAPLRAHLDCPNHRGRRHGRGIEQGLSLDC